MANFPNVTEEIELGSCLGRISVGIRETPELHFGKFCSVGLECGSQVCGFYKALQVTLRARNRKYCHMQNANLARS